MALFFNANQFLMLPQIINGNKKNVSFSKTRHLLIIPTRQEIIENNLFDDLWWSNNDYTKFKIDAFDEMLELKQKHPNINRQQLLKLLYQPGNICYDKSNFE